MEEETINRIYAHIDERGTVIRFFSEAFEQPNNTDVCIDYTNTDRHGAQKYQAYDEQGIPNYIIINGSLVERDKTADTQARQISELRELREVECFAVVNRGVLWYNRLTDVQREELDKWYQAWLDVTETLVIPTKPDWVDGNNT